MLNLDIFTRTGNQPALAELPTLLEETNEDDDSDAVGSFDSSYDSDYSSSNGASNAVSSTTEQSTTHRTDGTSEASAVNAESQKICWLRGFVLATVIVATGLLCIIIHHSLTRSEYEHYEAQFQEYASKILDAFESNLMHGIGEVGNLALSVTSYSKMVETPWPLAVIPEFSIRAASTRNLAGAGLVSLVPIVHEAERDKWEIFSQESAVLAEQVFGPIKGANQSNAIETIHSARHLQQEDPVEMESILQAFFESYGKLMGTPVNFTNGIATKLFRTDGLNKIVEDLPGPYYCPIWQSSPSLQDLVNYNLISHEAFGADVQAMVASEQVVVGKMADISIKSDIFNVLLDQQDPQASSKQHHGPVATILFPVFNEFNVPREIVATLMAVIHWEDYLRADTLPPEANGIVCVLANECGQTHSFEIVNGQVISLGQGDFHDVFFDQLESALDLKSFGGNGADTLEQTEYSTGTINNDYCPYSLSIYPSSRQFVVTNRPVIVTIAVLIVFAVTGFVFAVYDSIVEKRQQVLVKRAVRSHQIVSQLFPSNVRDRLFGKDNSRNPDEDEHEARQNHAVNKPLGPTMVTEKGRLKNFLNTGLHKEEPSSKPIADLFSHCTVLFGDIAGFTAWSSVREPAQVFTLLEAIWSAFDKIAIKRRVFKVETIGDCYVAVTGLPEPQLNRKFFS